MSREALLSDLKRVVDTIQKLIDPDIFTCFEDEGGFTGEDAWRAATVVADRLCGTDANPIVRNEQERRQLELLESYLETSGYTPVQTGHGLTFEDLRPGEFAFRLNVPGRLDDGSSVNIPVDAVIKGRHVGEGGLPLLIEAKSAGDFTNVNKRRKEEANKLANLLRAYGPGTRLVLLLCGYFDTGYLGYEAAEGCDWVWEHRLRDLELFGL